jgi:uncharacterized membrane protein
MNSSMLEIDTKNVALIATFTALVFVTTLIFQVGIVATNGFFNLGETMVYISALIGGPITGFIAGGLGSSLADVTLGYGQFAPGTFVIKGLEGFVVGYLFISMRKLSKRSIKIIYALFSFLFFSIASIITSPSLYNLLTSFNPDYLSTVFSDIGSSSCEFYLTLYYPEGSDLFFPHPYTFSLSGLIFILIALLLIALLWLSYLKFGEKSVAVLSCSFGGLIIVVGYFLYEVFILGLPAGSAFVEIPFNITQSLFGIAVAIPAIGYLTSLGIIENTKPNLSM